ncbi:glycosyltransferase [Bradyrhizobium sp. 180]|uniref:glycosyltransferase n=1 Tax=unclassified Bradyrhizobium TaxID=2631580 RepID=UPI001FF8464B|nr:MULTISPECIES: glycosyltransferase [unclassified Bradyrhizobium]MCK1423143.1 glycosyltransferase [Bradyrhizobium sp. CW12]MCK1492963.1 glycosyltransferase [Bradyrhizobium sp. 180]MCK1531266.1 glycosyltransferase [Bradyrhizobium sp. 182]MCK1599129.1 glycosyltransferase [Bradyrhizobium sp. 164]MCK1645077.1 glycosyltransferase [Bradyrhizobium sp. 154]
MKIALIDPSLFTWPYDLKLAKGLTDIGHAASIVGRQIGQKPSVDEDLFLDRHFYPGLQSRFFKKLPRNVQLGLKGLSHAESMTRLIRRFRRMPPDVIHFQWAPLAIVDSQFIPMFRRVAPTVLTVHDSNPFNNNPSSRIQRIGAFSILHCFDHLIVHTTVARDRLLRVGIPDEKISVIAHGLLTDHITRPADEPSAGDGRVQILLFGKIKPYKGVDVMLRALALLPREVRANCVVKVVGWPEMAMEPLFAMVKDLQLEDNVEFDLRFVPEDEVTSLVARADILAFPYRDIDASGVLMLAIAGGRPIVASNLGTFSEWLSDRAEGTLVPPGDPAALSRTLERLISDPDYRNRKSQGMLELRDSVPTWTSIARLTEAAYAKAGRRVGTPASAQVLQRSGN